MLLDTYEIEHRPRKGYAPPIRAGRLAADRTYGGAVVHSSAGHLSDQIHTISYHRVESLASKSVLYTQASEAPGHAMAATGALACPIPVGAGLFAAPASMTAKLLRAVAATGLLSVEVWDSAGAGPRTKVGLLGVIDVADISSVAFTDVECWSDVAWPLLPPNGGFVVINATQLAGGTVTWGEAGAGAYYSYTPAGGWVLEVGVLGATIWQGSQYPILRGMAGAYCYPGGSGPADRTLEMDDGHRYTVRIIATRGAYSLTPMSRTGVGRANVEMDVMFVAEIGEQDLTPGP